MKVITFRLTAEEPILVTSFQGDPNSDVSYEYIPGSAIRGALIGRFLKVHPDTPEDIVADAQVRSLFFEHSTRFLNAYLNTEDKKQPRSLPVPLSWRLKKGDESYIFDQSQPLESRASNGQETNEDDKKLVRVSQQFCCLEDTRVILCRAQRRINVHHQRDRKRGRATRDTGQVYRYESLESGQSFEAVILCDQDQDAIILEQLLKQSETFRIGGSQTAGYGKITISNIQQHEVWAGIDKPIQNSWTEVGKPIQNRLKPTIKITLLSDAIVCDENGQYTIELPAQEIACGLGIERINQTSKSYMGNEPVGGFNRKWGLPLPQVQAIAAGSVFVFENLTITPEQAVQLEWQGIGERRNEGFGRVAINWLPEQHQFTVRQPERFSSRKTTLSLLPSSEILAQEMATRLLRQKLDLELEKKLAQWPLSGDLTNSQLSRLMLVANQALLDNNPKLINQFFDNLRSNAKTKFASAKLGSQPLQSCCLSWLKSPKEKLWNDRNLTADIAGQKGEVTEELGQEYTLRLMIAIARKGIKQAAVQEK